MILSPTLEMEVEKCFLDQASLCLIPKEEEPHERRRKSVPGGIHSHRTPLVSC